MNYTLRNIVGIVLILFILIFGYYFLFARQKGQYIPAGWGDFDCMYPTIISSDSLQPTLKKGSILILNSCIRENTYIGVGTVVLFNKDGIKEIGVVDDVINKDRVVSYTVSLDSNDTQKYTITFDELIAYTVVPDTDWIAY